jgi:hypothetical protein
MEGALKQKQKRPRRWGWAWALFFGDFWRFFRQYYLISNIKYALRQYFKILCVFELPLLKNVQSPNKKNTKKTTWRFSHFFVKHFRHRFFSKGFNGVFELHLLRNA